MSIFDGLTEEDISQLLTLAQGQSQPQANPMQQQQPQYTLQAGGGLMGGDGLTQNMPGTGMSAYESQAPQAPSGEYPDVSAFANAGMTPPDLPDPVKAIAGLMSISNAEQPKRQQPAGMPKGGLMAYLQSLGV